jgi:hypothetical protein
MSSARPFLPSGVSRQSEKLLHQIVDDDRLRADREFFRVDFLDVERRIQEALNRAGLELRTLPRPAALQST